MIETAGNCKFCGQVKFVELPDDTPDSLMETEACNQASLECKCKEGSSWRADMLVIEKCSDNIETIFRDEYPEIADIFQEAKLLVYGGTIKKITCSTPTSGTAAMFMKGGSIMTKFTQKSETEMSADW